MQKQHNIEKIPNTHRTQTKAKVSHAHTQIARERQLSFFFYFFCSFFSHRVAVDNKVISLFLLPKFISFSQLTFELLLLALPTHTHTHTFALCLDGFCLPWPSPCHF